MGLDGADACRAWYHQVGVGPCGRSHGSALGACVLLREHLVAVRARARARAWIVEGGACYLPVLEAVGTVGQCCYPERPYVGGFVQFGSSLARDNTTSHRLLLLDHSRFQIRLFTPSASKLSLQSLGRVIVPHKPIVQLRFVLQEGIHFSSRWPIALLKKL